MKALLIEAHLKSFRRTKDNGASFTFESNREVSIDEFSLIDQYYQQNGWFAFQINEIDASLIPQEQAVVKGAMSPSQQLRNALFAKHMKEGGTKDTFTPYYQKAMAGFTKAVTDSMED